mgnify:CR=1 FL=1
MRAGIRPRKGAQADARTGEAGGGAGLGDAQELALPHPGGGFREQPGKLPRDSLHAREVGTEDVRLPPHGGKDRVGGRATLHLPREVAHEGGGILL